MTQSLLQRIENHDDARPGFPGEHWLAFGAALAVWLGTRRHPSLVVRVLGSVAGTALVARSVTGRDVPPQLVRWLPFQRGRRRPGER